MQDLSRTLRTAFTRAFNRRTRPRAGRLEVIPRFTSAILGNERQVTVYLPPGYDEHRERHYPVLYMQDGQNLFDPYRAFAGNDWRLHLAADSVIDSRKARPMIIVGVDHAGVDRMIEYTPVADPAKGGGRGDDYGRMLIDELKPMIDSRFRTRPDEVSIGGSSLGGLIAMHLAISRPDLFRSAAILSPSVWWGQRAIVAEVDGLGDFRRPRIWLDIGGREGREALLDVRLLRDHMLAHGWSHENLRFFEDRRGDHSERAWASRVDRVLEFLFPAE